MAERQPAAPTHRVYTVIRREGQDDYWLNIGLAFPHKDGNGFNIVLQALPLDGKIVCREVTLWDWRVNSHGTSKRIPADSKRLIVSDRHIPRVVALKYGWH